MPLDYGALARKPRQPKAPLPSAPVESDLARRTREVPPLLIFSAAMTEVQKLSILGRDDGGAETVDANPAVTPEQSTGMIVGQLLSRHVLFGVYRDQSTRISPPAVSTDCLDAVVVATKCKNAGILRLLLEHDHEKGRWFTKEGRKTLKTCLEVG
jgi:hypothetical protein